MYDPAPERGPQDAFEKWVNGLFVALLAGMFLAIIFVDYQPEKLTILFYVAFWALMLAVHEAGHALMAWWFGWRVVRIVIGMGKPLAEFAIGPARVELRLIPIQGFVQNQPVVGEYRPVQHAWIYFAGPGIELLVLLGLLLVPGWDALLTRTTAIGMLAVQSLALVIVLGVVINLIPQTVQSASGPIPNDGAGILVCLLMAMQARGRSGRRS